MVAKINLQFKTMKSFYREYTTVFVTALSVYLNSLNGDFVHDDLPAIVRNQDVLGTSSVSQILLNDFWGTPMSHATSHKSYRPLTVLSFRANNFVSGLQPLWFHASNVVLHAIASVLFTRLVLVVVGLEQRYAMLAGLLFATHPVHTEAVAGIVGRADILACIFFLLSFLTYHDVSWKCRGHMVISFIMALCAMLAKETGVTVLLVNLLYDAYVCWHPIKRATIELKWNEDALQFSRRASKVLLVICVLLLYRLIIMHGSLPSFLPQDNPAAANPCPQTRLLTFCYLAVFNVWLLLCPSHLSHDWQFGSIPLVTSLGDVRNFATCLLFVSCFCVVYKSVADLEHHRSAPLVIGGLLVAIPFLPASNLLFTVGFVVAERILYIPSMGLILLLAYGAQILHSRRRKLLIFASYFLLVIFSVKTISRNYDWSSRQSLIKADLRTLPHNAKMHYNWANYLREDGSKDALAEHHYFEALRLWPAYSSAYNNLGTMLMQHSVYEAETYFLKAISYNPNHSNAYFNLGQVYRKLNRTQEAIEALEKCIASNRNYVPAYLLLAKLCNKPFHLTDRLYNVVLRIHPSSPDHLAYYADWLRSQYRYQRATKIYEKSLGIDFRHRDSILGLAQSLRLQGQMARLHQLILRWQVILNKRAHHSKGPLVYSGDLYITRWDEYKQGQITSIPAETRLSSSSNSRIIPCANIQLSGNLLSKSVSGTADLSAASESTPCVQSAHSEHLSIPQSSNFKPG
uniref:dolichyl-phosphate-mannose--protein mannosyltransferase n=1 Tax=Cacopsylla melanoneura TaxID=428564 RepID=A0A8D8YQH0_9HEMI